MDILCCVKVDGTPNEGGRSFLTQIFDKYYFPFLMKLPVQLVIVCILYFFYSWIFIFYFFFSI